MIDVIIIGVVALIALGVVTYVVHSLLGLMGELNAARDLYEKQREATDDVIRERDELTAAIATERAKSKTLLDQLSITESQRNDATRALAAQVAKEITDAPDAASALDAINSLLASHLPGGGTAPAGGDGGETPAVQAAAGAAGGEASRHA